MIVCNRFENCSLDNYQAETPEQKRLVETLADGIKNGFKDNILIVGSVGTGKTHLAYSIVNALEEKRTGYSNPSFRYYSEDKVKYCTIKSIIDNIKASWKDPSASEMWEYCNKPLLIIDEIGVQYGTDSERTELYEVFNRRYEGMLPIIAISNHDEAALLKILGQRIFDRLTGGAKIFTLSGKSYRQGGGK